LDVLTVLILNEPSLLSIVLLILLLVPDVVCGIGVTDGFADGIIEGNAEGFADGVGVGPAFTGVLPMRSSFFSVATITPT
jgi:hypothetical protein